MTGKTLAVLIALAGLIAGLGLWYAQEYAYYTDLPPQDALAVTDADGAATELPLTAFTGTDSDSSPIRTRICATLADPAAPLAGYPGAAVPGAPRWLDCFDPATISDDLDAGAARAVLVQPDATPGIDRVGALYPDGRLYVWPQINRCGAARFNGDPVPADCPGGA